MAARTTESSHWALISILIVIILFSAFWLWQKGILAPQIVNNSYREQQPVAPAPKQSSTQPTMSDLEASTVNIVIPSFEQTL